MFRTPEDFDAFEDAAAAKLRAEASNIRSKAALRRCAGVGGLIAGVGIAFGAGCFGYSYVTGNQAIARQVADGVAAALAHATINTQGTVTGQVSLLPATVGLDPHATVGMSPDSTVRAVMPDMPRPSAAQLQAEAKPASGAPVVTDFVIFHTVPYGKGEVQSGWRYADSNAQAPALQWCVYVAEQPDGTRLEIRLGLDGRRVDVLNALAFPSVKLEAAYASCVWADGKAATAPAPVNRDDSAPPPPHVITARNKG